MQILAQKGKAVAIVGTVVALVTCAIAADKLTIAPANPKQLTNSSVQFTATLNRQSVKAPLEWSSSNPAVAIVDVNGKATLLSPGSTTITVQLAASPVRESTVLTVTTAAPPVFATQPTNTDVGAVINPGSGVQVKLLDNLGGPLAGQPITLSIGANPPALASPSYGSGTLSSSLTQATNAAGIATFTDLKIDWLGNGYTLVASANPVSGPVFGTSAAFNELRVGDACLGPDQPACSSGCADTDLDGLNDAWEIAGGVDLNGDGKITDPVHDVLLPGADPNVPDIYLKYDYMFTTAPGPPPFNTPPHSHQPPPRAWDQMRAMFAAHGIVLHVLAPAGGIPEHRVTTLDPNAQASCAGDDFITMQQLRAQYFGNLRPAYHYMVFAHDSSTPADGTLVQNCPIDPLCGGVTLATGTGVADLPGDDAIISFGHNVDSNASIGIELWTGTMMHELGHNFGLVHGSLADPSDAQQKCMINKPNYISVMNYTYQFGINPNGIPGTPITGISCRADADCGPPAVASGRCSTANACFCTDDGGPGNNFCYRPDYAEDNLLNLNETTLDEHIGVGGPSSLDDIVFYWNNGGTLPGPSNGSPIDWNNDGVVENLTGCLLTRFPPSFVLPFCPDVDDNLTDSDPMNTTADWTRVNGRFVNLNFQFQCTAGYLNDVPAPPLQPTPASKLLSTPSSHGPSELTMDWAREHHHLYQPRSVSIAVSPGCSSEVKPIATGRPGVVRVALLGSDGFDVMQVDTASLKFHGAGPISVSIEDANGDGKPDLIATFDASTVKLHTGASVGRLTGWLKNSQAFYGEDKVRVVPSMMMEDPSCR